MEPARRPEELDRARTGPRPSKYRVYTLDELPALFEQWRREEPDPKEIVRRTRLYNRAARWRNQLSEIDIPVDELVRRAREELAGG
ncbi:MAG: hypothetical protein HY675_16535 [Chloroflexi bacterium]|nr:hypothetical protein [Chloroflexota bacterium]